MITWTRRTMTYNEATDAPVETVVTFTGAAIETAGDPQRYRELGLTETEAPTLLFVPDVYGLPRAQNTPQEGDETTWRGSTWRARSVAALAPDGFTILAKVIVGR